MRDEQGNEDEDNIVIANIFANNPKCLKRTNQQDNPSQNETCDQIIDYIATRGKLENRSQVTIKMIVKSYKGFFIHQTKTL